MRDIIISICIMAFFLIRIQIKVVYFQDDMSSIAHTDTYTTMVVRHSLSLSLSLTHTLSPSRMLDV